jgi:response regulator RpfG family c-di-GMP phosphodiesterase
MKVLFVGDSPENNYAIKKLMSTHFPKVDLIDAGKNINLLDLITTSGPFSFVVIAYDNPDIVANELFTTISDVLGQRPFIFIGTPAATLRQNIHDVVARSELNSLIEFPLVEEEFIDPVRRAVEWVQKEEFEESIHELTRADLHRMKIRNFYLFDKLPFDVYVELTATKYSKIISKDKPYSHRLIQDYSRKGIKFLYLRKDEHLKFLDDSIKKIIKVYDVKILDKKKIRTLHLQSIYFIQQYIKALNVSEDIIKLTQLLITSMKENIKPYDSLLIALEEICPNPNITFSEFSYACAHVCDAVIYNMGWNADMSRDKLFLASILQDIGLQNEELIKIRSLNNPNLKMFSAEDQELYKNHPQKAALIANYFNGFSDVDFILMEHHEHPTGDGFPTGANASGLTAISCVFILANNFVSRMAQIDATVDRFKKIYDGMKRIFNARNFKDPFKGLERALRNS